MTAKLDTSTDFAAWSAQVRALHQAVCALRPAALSVGVAAPIGEEWFELLERKLLAQLDSRQLLVVAVVGGTNIGKSVVFNHLAGETASRASPLAAGTKHPVCLTPADLADEALLCGLFAGFSLRPWQSADDPLTECDEHLLFWRVGQHTPPRLLLLDTPDVDSDARVNWERADHVRQSADVLVGVLTDQKYHDAAVKQFFRTAVEADKPIILVFNQCDVAQDREWWPRWLEQFTTETGARPELVYVVPRDRAAAAELRLPFYEVGPDGRRPPGEPASLRQELALLHFDAIKIRTFRGALAEVLDRGRGLPAWLERIRAASGQFSSAARALAASELARVRWPSVPPQLLVEEIRDWWDASRKPWSRAIHGVYRKVGQGLVLPIKKVWRSAVPAGPAPLEEFRAREREAIVEAVGMLLDELDRLAQVGNETLRPRLSALLGGDERRTLLARVQASHAALPPVDEDYRAFLRCELEAFRGANPRAMRTMQALDQAAAVARPAITISLALFGGFLVADVTWNVAAEAAVAVGVPAGGEALLGAAGEGLKQAAAGLVRRLQARYAQDRARWLATWLEQELLGDLLNELRCGAEVPNSDAFRAVEVLVDQGNWNGQPGTG